MKASLRRGLFLWGEGRICEILGKIMGVAQKNQSELPQKAKVKCHKKPKLFGGFREKS